MLFLPSLFNSKTWIAFSAQAIKNLLLIISPGLPSALISFAFKILILLPFNSNQDPGVGYKAFIFATISPAFVFQSILVSDLSIFFAYVIFDLVV